MFHQKKMRFITFRPYFCIKFLTKKMTTESHPLQPFLPPNAKVLMLGSFPPPPKRWCIDFYYPNFGNDMWRIMGLVFFADKNHFVNAVEKTFRKDEIVRFLNAKGIAIYDTATSVIREKDNASDKHLAIVRPTDVNGLLLRIPHCRTVVGTGQKSVETLCEMYNVPAPKLGGCCDFEACGRKMRLFRMPSSSRAYPLAVEKKAEYYRRMFDIALR